MALSCFGRLSSTWVTCSSIADTLSVSCGMLGRARLQFSEFARESKRMETTREQMNILCS